MPDLQDLDFKLNVMWLIQTGAFIQGKSFDLVDGGRVIFIDFAEKPFQIWVQREGYKTKIHVFHLAIVRDL